MFVHVCCKEIEAAWGDKGSLFSPRRSIISQTAEMKSETDVEKPGFPQTKAYQEVTFPFRMDSR